MSDAAKRSPFLCQGLLRHGVRNGVNCFAEFLQASSVSHFMHVWFMAINFFVDVSYFIYCIHNLYFVLSQTI
jgi:hypothetical protein